MVEGSQKEPVRPAYERYGYQPTNYSNSKLTLIQGKFGQIIRMVYVRNFYLIIVIIENP